MKKLLLIFWLLSLAGANVYAQTVTGTVTDAESDEVLPGVNIIVKGTATGTSTDAQGNYEVSVPSLQDTLMFSFIGYQQQEIPIEGRAEIDVVLGSQTIAGKEMVVVGYGTQGRKKMTESIGTVNMQSLENVPITSANEALAGQIPGVQVSTTQGIPGGGPKVEIRGVGSIGAGGEPLYVVDGFPLPISSAQISNPLNDILPSDIESISVLKGPSATAIYGSRGANGVIIITTKRGEKGKTKFSIDASTGWQKIPGQMKTEMMNARQFATFKKQWIEDQNRVMGQNISIPKAYQDPTQYGQGTDWFDRLTRVAQKQKVNFAISGGNKDLTSYISGGFLRQEGVVVANDYNKLNFRTNIDGNISQRLNVSLNIAPSYSFGKSGITGSVGRSGVYSRWMVLNPIEPVYNSDGSFNSQIGGPGLFPFGNPVQTLKQRTNNENVFRILGNGSIEYNLTNGLALESSFNVDYNNRNVHIFSPSTIPAGNGLTPTIPRSNENQSGYYNWVNENKINYEHTFHSKHNVKLTGVFSEQKQVHNSLNLNGLQFADNSVQTLDGANEIRGGGRASNWTLVSYFGRLNYSYKDRYLFSATIRRDGSSKFGADNRWGTFPSAALGWLITEEPWMDIPWLSNLKVRASYGVSGNNQIGNYRYSSHIGKNNYVLGNSIAPGRTINSMGNRRLAWQQKEEIDIGLDVGLLNDRVSITGDIYKSETKDLLLDVEIPLSSGYRTSLKNIGSVQNKGLELGVKSTNITTSNFTWTTNINFSINRNKTLALGPEGEPIHSGDSGHGVHRSNITKIGKPVAMLHGLKVLGLYTPEQIKDPDVPKFEGAVPGNLRLADVNNDGKISSNDRTIIGNPYPKFTYGLTSSMSYKNINFSVILSGSYGADLYKFSKTMGHLGGIWNLPESYFKNRYRSPQDPGNGKYPTTAGVGFSRGIYFDTNSSFVHDASYLWLKNIKLGYTFRDNQPDGNISSIQIYGNIRNAFVITPYPYGNPATANYTNYTGPRGKSGRSGSLLRGMDMTPYPTPRVFSIGAKINF